MGDIIDGIENWNMSVIWKWCFSEYDIDDMNWWGMNGKLMGYYWDIDVILMEYWWYMNGILMDTPSGTQTW